MFRNPRENVSSPSTGSLSRPSTGRPPTPPNAPVLPVHPMSNLASGLRNSPTSLMARASPLMAKKPSTTFVNGKAKPKPNSSILSFFKKTDGPPRSISVAGNDEGENLFFEDAGTRNNGMSRNAEDLSTSFLFEESKDDESSPRSSHNSRFNEDLGSVKKRKLRTALKEDDCDRKDTGSHETSLPYKANAVRDYSPPPPPSISAVPHVTSLPLVRPKIRGAVSHTGFFVDDSESDEEGGNLEEACNIGEPVQNDPSRLPATTTAQSESDHFVEQRKDAGGEQGGYHVSPKLEPITEERDEFDDMDDFEMDEFAAEGEEYMERRWMEEQRILEDGLDDEDVEVISERALALESDAAFDANASPDSVSACPICNTTLTGISEADASAHVNGCLDGKPVPLPFHIPTEPEKVSVPSANSSTTAKRYHRATIARPGQQNPFSLGTSGESSSAFSKLMSGHAEDAAWTTAAANEMASRGKPAYQRTCPFYKILPGLFICVDAFRYGAVQGCNAYFLSHFHSDHYIGLTSSWSHGPIYCSRVTGNLVRQQLKVDPKWVVDLEFEKTAEVPHTQGVKVTMIPANHCPGSSLFLFEKSVGKGRSQRVLHCGDFRACPAHVQHPLLRPEIVDSISGKTAQQRIDVCYLDTTYLTPKYSFPSQEDVIDACSQMCVSLNKDRVDSSDAWEQTMRERAGKGMVQFIRKSSDLVNPETSNESLETPIPKSVSTSPLGQPRGRLLIVLGTYSIGKERICLGIARALDCKIYATPQKRRVCTCLEDPELTSRLTSNPLEAMIHMQMIMEIRAETLQEYLNGFKPHFNRIVGFRPTGWNYRPPTSRFVENPAVQTILHSDGWKSRFRMADLVPQRGSTKEASCFGVPYSEHSSFRELTMFCCSLRIGRVIPTVNVGSQKSRERMKGWVEKWEAEKRKSGLFKLGEGVTSW